MMMQMKITSVVMFLALLLALGWQPRAGVAQNQGQNKTHTVEAGETLYSIARQYNVLVDELTEWNNLSGNDLSIGQVLIVGKTEQGSEDGVTHEVRASETLFSISKQYGVSITEIKRWNSLESNNLDIGQQLTIYPPDNRSSIVDRNSRQSLVVNTPVTNNTYYTVKSGDTLFRIAGQHNMTVDELKALNDLTSNTIRVGQQLTVKKNQTAPSVSESIAESSPQGNFVNYSVQQQQSRQEILQKFNMAEEEFVALNPDISSDVFRSGQKITVIVPPTRAHKNPYTVQADLKNLGETPVSVYDSTQIGTTTTSGELYNPDQLTAAHSNIALGSVIFIQNPETNKGIYVRINDRFSGNGLRLSHAAVQSLGLPSTANVNGTVTIYQDQ